MMTAASPSSTTALATANATATRPDPQPSSNSSTGAVTGTTTTTTTTSPPTSHPHRSRTKILTSPKTKPPPALVSHEEIKAQQEEEWRWYYDQVRHYLKVNGHLPVVLGKGEEDENNNNNILSDWMAGQEQQWSWLSPTRRLLLLQIGIGIEKKKHKKIKYKRDYSDDDEEDERIPVDTTGKKQRRHTAAVDSDDDDDEEYTYHANTTTNNTTTSSTTDVYEKNWLARFSELETFYQQHGHFRINKDDAKYKSLAYWVTRQRRRRQGKPNCGRALTKHQIDMLNQIGFPWVVPSGRGAQQQQQQQPMPLAVTSRNSSSRRAATTTARRNKYTYSSSSEDEEEAENQGLRRNHSHPFSSDDNDNHHHHSDVHDMSDDDHNNHSDSDDDDVDWNDPYERKWLESYRELKHYVQQTNGSFSFPEKDPSYKPLAYWVTRQRRLKLGKLRGQILLKHREKLLNQIHFPWVPERMARTTTNSNDTNATTTNTNPHDDDIDSHEDNLTDNDDDNSDNGDNDDEDLEESGRFEKLWMDRYKQLQRFYHKYGHFQVPKQDPKYKSLAYWVVSQRRRKAGKRNCGKPLPQNHVRLLDKIGFPWDGHEARRQQQFMAMEDGGEQEDEDEEDDDDRSEQSSDESVSERRGRARRASSSKSRSQGRHGHHHSPTTTTPQNAYEERWMAKYHDLQDFYQQHGHYCVEKGGNKYKSLAYWVIRQRELRNGKRRGESLLKHRERLLDKIGFPWDGHEARRQLTGNEEDNDEDEDDISMDQQQRVVTRRRSNQYSRNQSHNDESEEEDQNDDQLSESESSLDAENAYEKRWLAKYRELKQYFNKYGHFCIAESDPRHRSLAYWVHRQRELRNGKRRGENFPKHREELLDKINFQWDGREARREKEQVEADNSSGNRDTASVADSASISDDNMDERLEQQWMERYQELKDYVKKYGNFSVSKTDQKHKSLAYWMARQRQLRWGKKRGGLSNHRIELLDKINFPWSCSNDDQRKSSRSSGGRAAAGEADYDDSQSEGGDSAAADRNTDSEAEEHLSEAKEGSAGFHDQLWLTKFVELKRFYRKFGHFWCTRWSGEEYRPLSYWVEKQRQFSLSDELPPHRKKMLEDLGFPWDWREAKQQFLDLEAGSASENDDVSSSNEGEDDNGYVGIAKKSSTKKRKRPSVESSEDDNASRGRAKSSIAKVNKSSEKDAESNDELVSRVGSSNYGEQWLRQYESLKLFFQEHGHFIIPHTPEKYRSFYKWVWFQRKRLTQKDRKNPVVAAKVELLNRINFDWEGLDR